MVSGRGDAAWVTLIISDVPGNDPSMVASGPTIADTGSAREALEIVDRFAIEMSQHAHAVIQSSRAPRIVEPDIRVVATSDDALIAASVAAAESDVTPYSLGDLAGDARRLAEEHAGLALAIAAGRGPVEPPCVMLSGGETTVQVRGNGKGGRNGEYLLSLAVALAGHEGIYALAADTDGIDGAGDNAGARISPSTLQRATDAALDASAFLDNNDSYAFFAALGDLVTTGPTRTNVNDFRAIYVAGG